MTYYAVLDTNVLVSALLSSHDDAATVRVVEQLYSGGYSPIFSDEIIKEYNDVLRRKKFKFTESMVNMLISSIELAGENITPIPTDEVLIDIKDIPFYEVVMDKNDENTYLVTGNMRHFPKKPFIVTAGEFLDILKNKDRENTK